MFESQLQAVEVSFGASGVCTGVAIIAFISGSPVVGVFFLVCASATAAIGGWLLADMRGYHPALGVGLGIGFGVVAALFLVILPDASAERENEQLVKLRERKRRSQNYEVVDDDE